MTIDWLSGLVCGFVAAWFFLRGESSASGHQVRNPHSPVGQFRPDPPPAPPKPTLPPLRTISDTGKILAPSALAAVAAVAYCEQRDRGVFYLSESAICAIPAQTEQRS